MPTRVPLNCCALLTIVLVRPNFHSLASHQLNLALELSTIAKMELTAANLMNSVN